MSSNRKNLRYYVIVNCILCLLVPVEPAAIISSIGGSDPPPEPSQNATKVLQIGRCTPLDERIYSDNTLVENSGPSTLNGTMEVSKQSRSDRKYVIN